MTALQDWISNNPVDTITGAIRDVWRELTADDADQADEPQLMGRGLERC
ncbi:hypothetical protein [Mycolicibacterium vaccae]|jgi:hypothetical protein|uniref:Uncharacterized protein n=1 Tax=Mycolicibacterium vaccae ATCC 25954 TaxID=1194972 RepID=K0UER1_MYCVA|nr:hypothetical protein [Mycolicibacterium vaccae]EJZ05366.1 hypothetical protein MVAC_25370 [Mycolicibacterium vaccae ATCC 25954]MCV7060508.1 hypothetical protein [Mycolicibacterium vaccae]